MSDDPWRRRLARWMGLEDRGHSAPRPAAADEARLWVALDRPMDRDWVLPWLQRLPELLRSGLILHRAGEVPVRLSAGQRWRVWR